MQVSEITIKRTSSYGRYTINGVINGIELNATTTDSEAFDYFNDDEFPDKQKEAIEHCEMKLIESYENL